MRATPPSGNLISPTLWTLWILYNLLSLALAPALLVLLVLLRRDFRDPEYLLARLALRLPEPGEWDVWIHAVSVGEVRAAEPLVRALLSRGKRVVLTVSTRSAYAHLPPALQKVPVHLLPLDLWPAMQAFLRRIRSRWLLLVETEYWPNLLLLSRRAGRRVAVVNGRVSTRMYRAPLPWRIFLRELIRALDAFLMRNPADMERILALGAPAERVYSVGDLKFSVRLQGAENLRKRLKNLYPFLQSREVLVAGSTHPGEEETLLRAYQEVRRRFPETYLILAPRHPDRTPELLRLTEQMGLRVLLRSAGGSAHPEDLLLVDTIGELTAFYGLARIAFIGGSLVPRGGHNPIEAVAQGVPVLMGPHIENFSEIYTHFLQIGAARMVRTTEELIAAWTEWLSNPDARERRGRLGKEVVEHARGAEQRILEILSHHDPGL